MTHFEPIKVAMKAYSERHFIAHTLTYLLRHERMDYDGAAE